MYGKVSIRPQSSGAFSSDVMHKVVLNGIDFELPDDIWDAIDDAFGNYWNVEVGYGGWPDFNSAVRSISNWLHKEQIIFPLDKIATIVNVMFDWIEQIMEQFLMIAKWLSPTITKRLSDSVRKLRNRNVILKSYCQVCLVFQSITLMIP